MRELAVPCRGLSVAGDPSSLFDGIRVGIIGSRHPRDDAAMHARRIARDAAALGFHVVSGLAIGVDGIAHRAALDAGGTTIAVLASGLERIHPVSHRDLARRIAGSSSPMGVRVGMGQGSAGCVVTEYGVGDEAAYPHRFRERNRIIAALSDYLVVIQAAPTSGSMITAREALDLSVPIGIVPSGPTDPEYEGSIGLVRDGADCVVDGASLCWRLEIHRIVEPGFARSQSERAASGQLRLVEDHPLAGILVVPRLTEDVAELAGLDLSATRRLLMELEDDGLIACRSDGLWISSQP